MPGDDARTLRSPRSVVAAPRRVVPHRLIDRSGNIDHSIDPISYDIAGFSGAQRIYARAVSARRKNRRFAGRSARRLVK